MFLIPFSDSEFFPKACLSKVEGAKAQSFRNSDRENYTYHFPNLSVSASLREILFFDSDFLAPNSPSPLSSDLLSFRPKGEIYLRSLALARDDGPRPVTFAPLREINLLRFGVPFATFARDNDFSGFPNPQSKIEKPKLVDRQGKNKGAAFAHFALDPDPAAMQLDKLLGQG